MTLTGDRLRDVQERAQHAIAAAEAEKRRKEYELLTKTISEKVLEGLDDELLKAAERGESYYIVMGFRDKESYSQDCWFPWLINQVGSDKVVKVEAGELPDNFFAGPAKVVYDHLACMPGICVTLQRVFGSYGDYSTPDWHDQLVASW